MSMFKCITIFIYKIPGYFMHKRDILVTVYNEKKNEHLKKVFH
jgi:hypothetical protein